MAVAIEWSARITTIGLEMTLPACGGYWLDVRLGTSPGFLIAGAALGFALGIWSLLQIARQAGGKKP
jgi:F0F1-type ATP synthase assembly protein I